VPKLPHNHRIAIRPGNRTWRPSGRRGRRPVPPRRGPLTPAPPAPAPTPTPCASSQRRSWRCGSGPSCSDPVSSPASTPVAAGPAPHPGHRPGRCTADPPVGPPAPSSAPGTTPRSEPRGPADRGVGVQPRRPPITNPQGLQARGRHRLLGTHDRGFGSSSDPVAQLLPRGRPLDTVVGRRSVWWSPAGRRGRRRRRDVWLRGGSRLRQINVSTPSRHPPGGA
jgi:hypothetical protein